MTDTNTIMLFTDMVNGLMSKGWQMHEDHMRDEAWCYLIRQNKLVKVGIENNAIMAVVGMIMTELEGDELAAAEEYLRQIKEKEEEARKNDSDDPERQ